VCRAGTAPGSEARRALEQLLRAYLPALRAHLLWDRKLDSHAADDLLQAFIADKIIERNLVAAADPNRGKFRNFLLVTLRHFAHEHSRKQQAKRRSPGRKLEAIEDQADSAAVDAQQPSDAFDRAWAQEVLNDVLRRMRAHCEQSNQPHVWGIFEARMLLPISEGREAPSHEQLAQQYKLASASSASNALGTAKRIFTRVFREVVGEYANDDAEVDAEIRDLWQIFSNPPR
jgi:RNA polymerase sigma-70 factor (ECF subfamily)